MNWLQYYAVARFDLGLSDAEFRRSTFAQINALIEQRKIANYREDQRAAIVACTVANSSPNRRKRPYKISEFMPKSKGGKDGGSSRRPKQSPIQVMKMFQFLGRAHNRKFKGKKGD